MVVQEGKARRELAVVEHVQGMGEQHLRTGPRQRGACRPLVVV